MHTGNPHVFRGHCVSTDIGALCAWTLLPVCKTCEHTPTCPIGLQGYEVIYLTDVLDEYVMQVC
jgi:hypothetical protein